MAKDRSRYGQEKLQPFEQYLVKNADRNQLTFRPWGTYGLTDEQLIAHVQSEITAHGAWKASAEMAMGEGMSVRIEAVMIDGHAAFRATGGKSITISADYRSLERALDMAALFARVGWDMIVSTGWRDADLIDPEG